MRFDRGRRLKAEALSHAGVGVAGDTFDYRILDHVVSPGLGKGSLYRSFDNACRCRRIITQPSRNGTNCRSSRARRHEGIRNLIRESEAPEKIGDLVTVIEYDLGYELYPAVSRLKVALSAAPKRRSVSARRGSK